MDLLTMVEALGAVLTGSVPVVVILLWLIWREQRKQAEVEREKMRRSAKRERERQEVDRGGA